MSRTLLSLAALAMLAPSLTACGGVKQAQLQTLATPEDPDAWVELGDAYRRGMKKEKAKQSYTQAINLNPDHAAAQEQLRKLNKRRKLTDLEKLALANPHDDELWGDAGDEFMAMGMPDRALAYYKRAYTIDPSDSEWRDKLTSMGHADLIIDTMRQAVDRDPTNDELWGDYGDALRASGWDEQACEAYRTAREHDPADSEWQSALETCEPTEEEIAAEAATLPEDAAELAEGLNIEMEDADLLGALGGVYADKGQKETALSYYRKALERDPGNTDWQFQVCLLANESYLNLLKDLSDTHSEPAVWGQLGDHYVSLGRRDDAREAYSQAINMGGDYEWREKLDRLALEE